MKVWNNDHRNVDVSDSDALVIVDVQRDFCPGGTLPVPDGDQVVPILNSYIERFQKAKAFIYATRDWHPPSHVSFKAYGGVWPSHCVQDSEGAEFHPDLELPADVKIISKAMLDKETYSGFDETELAQSLREHHIQRLFIGGLATDYCVKNTAIDALQSGFAVLLLMDAIRGINAQPNDSEKAIEELVHKGARKITLATVNLRACENRYGN